MTDENKSGKPKAAKKKGANKNAAPTPPVAPVQQIIGSEADIREPFFIESVVHLWEKITEEVIEIRTNQLEAATVQVRATLEKMEANGANGTEDWTQLKSREVEIARQLEHTKTMIPNVIVFKAKTKGLVEVRVGTSWNDSLERHVIVEGGFVTRVLPRAPIIS